MAGWVRWHRSALVEFHGARGRETELDPRVWSRLPLEFICLILERVPTDSLMRWRRVSKTWIKDFLFIATNCSLWLPGLGEAMPLHYFPTESFSAIVQENLSQLQAFGMNLFNPSRCTWVNLEMPLHGAYSKVVGSRLFTAGDLVLLNLTFRNLNNVFETSMTVINPTTNKLRQLPPAPNSQARPIGMVTYNNGSFYGLVATTRCVREEESRLFLYKSDSDAWHDCGVTRERLRQNLDSAVSIGSAIYFVLHRRAEDLQGPSRSLVAFDLVTQTCHRCGGVPKPHSSGKPYLFENGGELMLCVRASWYKNGARHTSWRLYKFDREKVQWGEEKTMPEDIYRQLSHRIDYKGVKVTGSGSYIYFYGATHESLDVLACNTNSDAWLWLPNVTSALEDERKAVKDSILLSLQPSLMPVLPERTPSTVTWLV